MFSFSPRKWPTKWRKWGSKTINILGYPIFRYFQTNPHSKSLRIPFLNFQISRSSPWTWQKQSHFHWHQITSLGSRWFILLWKVDQYDQWYFFKNLEPVRKPNSSGFGVKISYHFIPSVDGLWTKKLVGPEFPDPPKPFQNLLVHRHLSRGMPRGSPVRWCLWWCRKWVFLHGMEKPWCFSGIWFTKFHHTWKSSQLKNPKMK